MSALDPFGMPPGGTPPEGAPPGGAPPGGAPPGGAPPGGAPPGWAPPEGAPPGWAPPEGAPPEGAPPGGTPPGGTPPGDPFPDGSAALDDSLPLDLLLDGDQFVFEPHPDEAPAFELPPVPGDGYAVEARAETMNMVTLGNSVRRGELDLVQIGAADVTDSVAGTETSTIEGMLREHTGGNLAYKSSRMETTVDGRMSVTTRLEDGIILGGTMTDIWNGGTFILAAMSDDLCIGAGARATAPVDLWLNYLTGLEERPGTANADGIFVEAYGTLFEREYGPSVHAAGIAVLNGTTYQTLKTGFRPLMHVAMGVRNLIPAAGGPTAEPAPPSPPATPVAAGGMAAGGIVMAGAGAARASVNVALSADSMLDMFRAGDAAVDIQNAADLRHAADTAAQVEDLRAAAANPQFADEAGQLNPTYASPHMEDLPGHPLADDPTYASPHMEDLPGHPLADDPTYASPLSDDFSGQPPPLPDGHPSMSPDGQPPPLPGGRPLPVDPIQQKVEFERRWLLLLLKSGDTWQLESGTRIGYLDMYKQADALAETDPQRAELLREVGSRLQMAHVAVQNGKDPSMILGGAAAHLEELGFADEAAALRRAMGDYDEFIAKMRVLGGGDLPPGVLDDGETIAGASFHFPGASFYSPEHDYDVVDDFILHRLESGDTWKGGTRVGYLDMYKQADALAETDPQRAELLRDVGGRLQMAHEAIVDGKDPRMILEAAADNLEKLGYWDEAAELRSAVSDYNVFLGNMRMLGDGVLPPGVLDFDGTISGASFHFPEPDYDVVGGPSSGTPPPAYPAPPPPRGALLEPDQPLHVDEVDLPTPATDPRKPAFLGDLPALTPLRPWPPPSSIADAPPPAFLDASPSSLPGGQGALDPQAGGHGSGAAADIADAARRQGDPLPQQPVQLEIPALQRLDAEGDDARRMLDVEPEQVVNAGEDATSVARLDVDPGTGTEGGRAGTGVEGINSAGGPESSGSGTHWKVEVPGPGRLDPDTGADAVLGDYADVVHHADSAVDGISDGQGAVHAAPPDTQAVADAMPDTSRITDGDYQTLADSNRKLTEGNALMDQLDREYLVHRRDSNWRATLAYGDALYELRDDIFEVLTEFGMYTDAASGPKPDAKTTYLMLVKAADRAAAAEDAAAVQRISEFLDGFNQRMQDTITDLGSRADEFEGVKTGSAFPLDPHIDQQKLAQWLDERMQDAARQMMEAASAGDAETQKAWSHEMTYFQQVSLALEQGRNPLIESGEQGVYLRETGRTEQAEVYLKLHDSLMETMSDPSFHKSAAEMGDTTYAPVLTRPELGAAPALDDTAVPAAVDNVDTDVLRAEVQEPGGASQGDDGAQMDAGDYAANRDTINDQAGQGDYVHAPQDQPSGLRDEDYDPVFDPLIDSAEANAARIQPGYVETVARVQGDVFERQFMADNPDGEHIDEHMTLTNVFTERRKVTDRARVDAANQMWGEMRVVEVDRRPLTEWNYRPPGMRSWKSPKQRAKAGKSVRFGDAKQITYAADSGLDTSHAVGQVPTPNRRGPPPGWKPWQPTRQPGFGRTASVPGEFPFSARERILNTLMQGKRFQAGTDAHDALEQVRKLGYDIGYDHGYATGPHANRWVNSVSSLVRDLGGAIKFNEFTRAPALTQEFVSNLDAPTLGKMLAMLEAGRTIA